jgi:hypothetical protein
MICITSAFSQFDKPSFQLGIGIVEPMDELKGKYYHNSFLGYYPITTPDTNLYRNNYGAKTGMHIFAKAKINFDKFNIIRGVGNVSFSSFNTFESQQQGNIGVRVINYNNEIDTVIIPVKYNYTASVFNIGLGLEFAPLAFTNKFTPYFGSNMTFNLISTSLDRNENYWDTISTGAFGFRIGFNFDAGIEFKPNNSIGITAGVKYDLGNVLLKNTSSSLTDVHEWGRTGSSLNDEEGYFYSTIYNPVLTSDRYQVRSKTKNINWGTLYAGVTFYINTAKSKPKKK